MMSVLGSILPGFYHGTNRWYLCLFSFLFIACCLIGCQSKTGIERSEEDGILIVGNNSEPQSLDPHIATSVSDYKIINSVMEGLLRGDVSDDTVTHPGVAESWESNPAADRWTFRLRKDLTWSDGFPLTAYDFVYAYHRLLHPNFGGRCADMLYPLKNAERYNKGKRAEILCGAGSDFAVKHGLSDELLNKINWDAIDSALSEARSNMSLSAVEALLPDELSSDLKQKMLTVWHDDFQHNCPDLWEKARVGVRAKDDYTLELDLRAPMPQLPLLLLHCTWFPVPVHALEANGGMLDRTGSWTRPGKAVGNGPFTITDHRFNHYLEVRRNPRYRQADKVSLNGIRFLPTVNGFTETRMYFNGKIHITNNVPSEMNEYARRRGGKEFCQDDYYVTVFYRLNTTRYPLNDQRVRQALSFAVDREALVQQVVCGGGHPCFAFTPDGAGYHPPHTVTFDPEKARRLLAEAGFPQGKGFPHLELMTSSREVQRTMAEAIQGMWKKYLGIHVDIRSCEWTAYKFAQNTMQYDFSSSSWSGDYLDPSSFLELWGKASGNNNTGWTHPEYERLLEQSRHCGSQSERMELLAEAEQIMLAESPVIPLYWSKRSYLKRPEVRGWFPLLLDNHLFESVRFDRESNDNREDRP